MSHPKHPFSRSFFAFARFFRFRARFHSASRFTTSSFETAKIERTALSNRSNSESPGTSGGGFFSLGISHSFVWVTTPRNGDDGAKGTVKPLPRRAFGLGRL